jgi:hypothetical protein
VFAGRDSYADWLKNEFGDLVDSLELDQNQKRFLRSRWLDQVVWVETAAHKARNRYYRLRLTTVVGAVLVPALVSVNTSNDGLNLAARITTWVVSLIVAVSAAVEQFFHFGERWRNYRRTAERLKTEGWLFLQLSGPYNGDNASHATAYPAFATRVEQLMKADVDVYLTEVAVEKEKQKAAPEVPDDP